VCPVAGSRCISATCGNGVLETPREQCDDGLNDGSYGTCGPDCFLASHCGDAVVDAPQEACDDGQNDGGYGGCRPNCQPDPHCGDGLITHAETCDDTNATAGDGCGADCQVESGYLCRLAGAACALDSCGNGTREAGEGCEDGNHVSGDGCDETCTRVELGFDCPVDGVPCGAKACGDGIVAGLETCDDGNATDGDGCSRRCQLEGGWVCNLPNAPCTTTVCGDGVVEGTEQCDDGNDLPLDGCLLCQLELGWACPAGLPCYQTVCGDGVLEGAEQCDDNNPTGADGCDALCQRETGFACPTVAQACHQTVCGDGTREGDEACDDANLAAGDGCDPLCGVEPIYDCSNGVCTPTCGDGITLYPFEDCDDGNLTSGDGCSSLCTREPGWSCTDFSLSAPASIDVPIVVRDFRGYDEVGTGDGFINGNGHPDFQSYGCAIPTTGLVQPALSADGKPAFASLTGSNVCGQQLSSQASFEQWYRDTNQVNHTVVLTLALGQDLAADPTGRTYVYDSTNIGGFFPIDGLFYGNTPGNAHNFSFTTEFHAYFEYRGGETLNFNGDDDVWAFINGRLAVDLGGLHPPSGGSVTLSNTDDPSLGLVYDPRFDIFEGGIYEIAFFHAERHTSGSNYTLTLAGFVNTGITFCDAVCGDGFLRGTEQCDDGNLDPGDGCSATCTLEPRPDCGNNQLDAGEACDDGNIVASDDCTNQCQLALCGDHVVWAGFEECDDGNAVDSDLCTNACTLPICGDGVVGPGETCDDGVNNGSYGSCTWDCARPTAHCGDGIVDTLNNELCDDGVNDGLYGTCNADCSLAARCGDGHIDTAYGEGCDDANTTYGDGCNGVCLVEVGWQCVGEASVCTPIN